MLFYKLSGATTYQLGRLQRIQNRAARLINEVGIRDHITPVVKELHWLPVESRIHFKVFLYIFKALRGQAPQYLGQSQTTWRLIVASASDTEVSHIVSF